MAFILASQSPRRKELLHQVGYYDFEITPPHTDESPLKKELPKDYVLRVSREKLNSALKENPEKVILSADTVVAKGRRILGKSETALEEEKALRLLSGARHRVLSAVCLYDPKTKSFRSRVVQTLVSFKRLSDEEIRFYIDSCEWKGKAVYAIQGLGGAFVKSINGSPSSVIGLPLFETKNLLESAGIFPAVKGL